MKFGENTFVTAERLKELRKSRGLSHQKLSNELRARYDIKISKDILIAYESPECHARAGANNGMSARYLRCLADFYGVAADYLLGLDDVSSTECSADDDIEKVIGDRIAASRKLNDKETQAELAAAMGVSREIVQHWESATRKTKATHIVKLAKHFNITADYLLGIRDYGTYDTSVAVACETTGLSQKAVERLQSLDREQIVALSSILESLDQFLIIGGTK